MTKSAAIMKKRASQILDCFADRNPSGVTYGNRSGARAIHLGRQRGKSRFITLYLLKNSEMVLFDQNLVAKYLAH